MNLKYKAIWFKLCRIYLIISISIILLIPAIAAGVDEPDISEENIEEESQTTYKLYPPGKDPRQIHLIAGEKLFRSRKLNEARSEFQKVLELESQNPQAHYYLGLIDYEQGNIQKAKTRFRIAHECLSDSVDTVQLPTDDKQVQLEVPDGYIATTYYRDGWYTRPKNPKIIRESLHSLEVNSTYKIQLKSEREKPWTFGTVMAVVLALSFFIAR
jgi:tetratricopeptide (TPR) repeat protein